MRKLLLRLRRSRERDRGLMHLFMFLFMVGRTARFVSILRRWNSPGINFRPNPLLSSSSSSYYCCPRANSSSELLVGPSRSIGNITSQNLKLNHFTALVPTLVPRFHVFRSFLFSNLESKVAFFEIYNLKIFDRKRENIESKRIRRIILELESIVEQFQFRGGILKISNYSFYTNGRDGFFATPCNNFQQFEEDRFLFPLLRIDSLLILTLFPLFDPVIFLQNRTVNPIPRPFLLVLTSIKPFLVYTLGQ